MNRIYYDAAATTKPTKRVVKAITEALENDWANPSSATEEGRQVRLKIEAVRQIVADSINAEPDEIYFTSGGSEANAMAINGWIKHNKGLYDSTAILRGETEHSSIDNLQLEVDFVASIDFWGKEKIKDQECYTWIRNCSCLASCMMANNETGIVYPIKKIAEECHSIGAILHVDAVQAYPHLNIDVKDLGIDMMSVSGHKFGCPKGIGFLYVRKGIEIEPIIAGTQENGLRGGTENVPYIIGLGEAVKHMPDKLKKARHDRKITDYIANELKALGVERTVTDYPTLPNILSLKTGVDNKQLVALMDEFGVAISAGSACHEGSKEPSKVLLAMGLTPEEAHTVVRVSLPVNTSMQEAQEFVHKFKMALKVLN